MHAHTYTHVDTCIDTHAHTQMHTHAHPHGYSILLLGLFEAHPEGSPLNSEAFGQEGPPCPPCGHRLQALE